MTVFCMPLVIYLLETADIDRMWDPHFVIVRDQRAFGPRLQNGQQGPPSRTRRNYPAQLSVGPFDEQLGRRRTWAGFREFTAH